jgi:hypothetical protein
MNAAASSLIEAIKYSFGADPYTYPPGTTGTDWDNIPSGATSWLKYGSGGVSSWGSLCGVPNGCIAVLNMMNWHGAFADQIMYYACQAEFPLRGLHDIYLSDPWVTDSHDPNYLGPEPLPDDEVLAYTVANSPLCHVSVSRWAYAAKVSMTATTPYATAHKTDRCAKVAASVASFVAGLINGETSSLTMPAITAGCYDCHKTSSLPAQQGKMDCGYCHTDFRPHTDVSKNLVIEDVWTEDGAGNAKDTFAGGDTIVCKLKFSVMGPGTCFVKTVKSKAKNACGGKILGLPMNQTVMSGTNIWAWSGTVPGGCSGAAKVIMNLNAFDYQGGSLLAKAKKNYNFVIA